MLVGFRISATVVTFTFNHLTQTCALSRPPLWRLPTAADRSFTSQGIQTEGGNRGLPSVTAYYHFRAPSSLVLTPARIVRRLVVCITMDIPGLDLHWCTLPLVTISLNLIAGWMQQDMDKLALPYCGRCLMPRQRSFKVGRRPRPICLYCLV